MYTAESIQQLAKTNKLIDELIKILLSKTQDKLVIYESSNLSKLIKQLTDDDVLVTNDNYDTDKCDFKVIVNRYILDDRYWLFDVNSDGSELNNFELTEYYNDIDLCENIAKRFNIFISECINVYIPVYGEVN